MNKWMSRLALIVIALLCAGALYLALREKPIAVDLAEVATKPMQVTIDEEGETRVREIYVISSPIAGHLDRTALEEGEAVKANNTIIASIHPLDPPFLDERTLAELKAAAEAAHSAIALAKVEQAQARLALELAQSEHKRAARLMTSNVISESQMERIASELSLKQVQVESADAKVSLREAELASVKAKLRQPGDLSTKSTNGDCCVRLTSPVDGVVLAVKARSEQAVSLGMPIAEIGDPADLEIVVDLLSSDAPRIKTGSQVEILDWGGDMPLKGKVARIDPAAFTKVSSLGIEEQRVNAIIDLETVPPQLGHGYHALIRLQTWADDTVLQIPIGAMFRSGGEWAVFAIEEGRAALREITIGQMNDEAVQVLEGLQEGDRVILYPSDVMEDGKMIEAR